MESFFSLTEKVLGLKELFETRSEVPSNHPRLGDLRDLPINSPHQVVNRVNQIIGSELGINPLCIQQVCYLGPQGHLLAYAEWSWPPLRRFELFLQGPWRNRWSDWFYNIRHVVIMLQPKPENVTVSTVIVYRVQGV